MMFKCSSDAKRTVAGKGKGNLSRIGVTVIKMSVPTGSNRSQRRLSRTPSKRIPSKAIPGKLNSMARTSPGKVLQAKRICANRTTPSHNDNSNDSGLGFDHHMESSIAHNRHANAPARSELSVHEISHVVKSSSSRAEISVAKRLNMDLDDLSSNDASYSSERISQKPLVRNKRKLDDEYSNAPPVSSSGSAADIHLAKRKMPLTSTSSTSKATIMPSQMSRAIPPARPMIRRPTAAAQPPSGAVTSRDGKIQLQILAQPEQQHRARYQTEGSRGAVKDRSGNGFPIVKLTGYNKPTALEIFIGNDVGRVAPHMFYQACKVSGKNSTQCVEKKLDGTIVIEIDLKPDNEMTATCDCVGILKERNVDVEHRFPEHSGSRSKKKSTRCRMVFRTQVRHDDGTIETLQICSHPIICTQPPGIPEVSIRSLNSCSVLGGENLFIFGKNFLKDTRVVFQAIRSSSPNRDGYEMMWEETVLPDKEHLQQAHLVCQVPPYGNPDIVDPVTVQFFIISSNKRSEPHSFVYTPKIPQSILTSAIGIQNNLQSKNQDLSFTDDSNHSNPALPLMVWTPTMEPIHEMDSGMMPPPSTLPLSVRRPSSAGTLLGEQISPPLMKTELNDESSQSSLPDTMNHDALDRMTINENSMDGSTMKDIYGQVNIRKRSIDIMDNNSMMGTPVDMLMHDSNNFNCMPPNDMKIVDLRVKQEMALHQFDMVVSKADQSVNKFLPTNLSPRVNPAALYSNSANNNLLQEMNNMNSLATTNSSFGHSLMTEANTATSLNQILNYPPNSTNETLMDTSNSNHSHDVILNSQPAAAINSPTNIAMLTASTVNTEHNMSSDVILNPSVSPSMMCQSADSISPQVTSVLACHAMQQHSSQESLLNNLTDALHIPRTSPVAVKTMLLADLLSSQPSQISAENTINALMSLNSSPMMTDNQQNVSQMMIDQSTTSSNTMMLHANNTSALNDALCTQATLDQHMPIFNNEPSIMATNQILANSNINTNTGNMMNSMRISNDQIVISHNEYLNDLQKEIPLRSLPKEHESLLDTVSLQHIEMNKERSIANQFQNIQNTANTTTAPIPQEITNMSDNDLLKFIDPQVFNVNDESFLKFLQQLKQYNFVI
ncbi:Nuclear factor of activated T-cells 5, partial [Pseudolycoriella hygida]